MATTVKPWSFSYALKILRGPRMKKLCRKSELLPLQHFCDVQIEKVAIEDGLDTAGEDRNQVEKSLEVVSRQESVKEFAPLCCFYIAIILFFPAKIYVRAW